MRMTLWIVVIYFWFVKTLRRPRYQLLAPISLMNLCHLGLTGAARARGGRAMAQPGPQLGGTGLTLKFNVLLESS